MAADNINSEYYKRLIDDDFMDGPPTPEQQAQMDSDRTFNELLPEINAMGEDLSMRTRNNQRSQKAKDQIESDRKAYEKGQIERDAYNAQMGRTPQSVDSPDSIMKDILLGKPNGEFSMLPPKPLSSQLIESNIPKLSDSLMTGSGSSNIKIPNAPTTAPTDITEKSLANQMSGQNEYIDLNLQGAPEYQNQVKNAMEITFDAEAAKAAAEAEVLSMRKAELEAQMTDNEERYKAAEQKAQEQIDSLGPVDPDRIWKNKSMWAKLALVYGAARQGRAGSDAGLKMMQDLVANDIDAQKASLAAGVKKGDGLLEVLKPLAGNRTELLKLTNSVAMKMAEKYGDLLKQGVSRSAAQGLAIQETRKYTNDLLALQNLNNKNLMGVSEQQQKRKNDDNNWLLKNAELRLDKEKQKFTNLSLSAKDQDMLVGTSAMAGAARRMKQLENDKNFDPTKITYAISQYMQGKGVPSSLNKDEGEYLMNYLNYFSYKRQALTGAAAAETEEERIKLLIAPDKTFNKKSIRIYQAQRAKDINNAILGLNVGALKRIENNPDFREFDINRGKLGN